MRKKFISFIVFVAIIVTYFSFISFGSASAAVINDDEYGNMAAAFLYGIGEGEFSVESVDTIYTLEEEIFGCKVDVISAETGKKGYVIFNTNDAVIEFSTDSQGSAFDTYKDSKIYYNGDLNYYFKKNDNYISIEDGKSRRLKDIKINRVKKISEDYGFRKSRNKNNIGSVSAAPADSLMVEGAGRAITNPESLFTQIHSVETKNINNFDFCYLTTANYTQYINHSGPVAALNLIIWFDRNGYGNLITSSMPYTFTFQQILDYMNFSNQFSTVFQVRDGIYNCFHYYYNTSAWQGYTDIYITTSDIMDRVNQKIPSIYGVGNHSFYGDQHVLLVGYKKITTYWYNFLGWKCYSDYVFLRVADSWYAYANRYINFADASLRTMAWLA